MRSFSKTQSPQKAVSIHLLEGVCVQRSENWTRSFGQIRFYSWWSGIWGRLLGKIRAETMRHLTVCVASRVPGSCPFSGRLNETAFRLNFIVLETALPQLVVVFVWTTGRRKPENPSHKKASFEGSLSVLCPIPCVLCLVSVS